MDTIKALRDRLATMPASPAVTAWQEATDNLPTTASGTMRVWMQARHGRDVHTFQWHVTDDGQAHNAWAPGARRVDASRASFVRLGGSRRDYAGVRVVAADAHALIVRDGDCTVVYRDA